MSPTTNARYFPYGEEAVTTSQDRTKFATYLRDSASGLDYAQQRYYARTMARFTSPDPYWGSAQPASPQSWNRYAYALNDPANFNDPSGMIAACHPGTRSTGWTCIPSHWPSDWTPVPPVAEKDIPRNPAASRGLDRLVQRLTTQFVELQAALRGQTAEALRTLAESCKDAIGAKLDFNAVMAVAGEMTFYDVRQPHIAGWQTYDVSGDTTRPLGQSLADYLGTAVAAVLYGRNWLPTHHVVVGAIFFNESRPGRDLTLVHEALHVAFQLNDVGLATKLDLGSFRRPGISEEEASAAASRAITEWLRNDCLPQ